MHITGYETSICTLKKEKEEIIYIYIYIKSEKYSSLFIQYFQVRILNNVIDS